METPEKILNEMLEKLGLQTIEEFSEKLDEEHRKQNELINSVSEIVIIDADGVEKKIQLK